jgi:hypothetical protein
MYIENKQINKPEPTTNKRQSNKIELIPLRLFIIFASTETLHKVVIAAAEQDIKKARLVKPKRAGSR